VSAGNPGIGGRGGGDEFDIGDVESVTNTDV